MQGANQIKQLQLENQKMWNELETNLSLALVTQTENELQLKKEELMSMYVDTQNHQRVKSAKNRLYREKKEVKDFHENRLQDLTSDLKTRKHEQKTLKEERRTLMQEIKQ